MDDYVKFPEFIPHIKRAKSIVESAYERRMHGNSPTGAIFVLKNMGWTDKQEVHSEQTGSLTIKTMVPLPDPLPPELARAGN